ncbi:hypothetical protein GGS23DRAFT_107448 [Durotheca rogersii]|uniref:uncharacterized protein n=1 Tax=Durotheca rogersii TaxID=419775 RepID=UPI00221FEBCC|nr:uncharacterized protein GGS23DRAFT_107448 [Durotheca rogersii]KAI5862143.1 hypothetical protein GGS23DRAFT_107448 [Durotheca rogersii]
MPHIGVLMERSLQERSLKDAFRDLLSRSAIAALSKRQTLSSVQTAFSSWDNCMAADFCKWPVIAVIVVGGLIIASIVWCIIRCACCGLSCCCQCCYCLKCCGECCGCCTPPRDKRHKYLDDPFIPPNHEANQGYRTQANQGYHSQAPMNPTIPTAPQYAEFDVSSKKDADALPAMPSWEDAQVHKVLVEEDAVEMKPLQKPENAQNVSPGPNAVPTAGNISHSTTPSPISGNGSPYGPPPAQGGPNGYMAAAQATADPYAANGQGYGNYNNYNGYGQPAPGNMDQAYGVAAAASVGRRTPHQDYNNGYDNGYGRGGVDQVYPQSRTPRPYNDEYGRGGGAPGAYGAGPGYRAPQGGSPYGNPGRMASPGPQAGYGYDNPTRMGSPGPQAGYGYDNPSRMRSPIPQIGAEYPPRSQTQTPASYARQYPSAPPQRQYSNDSSRPLVQPAAQDYQYSSERPLSPIQNNAGFDFNSGYSRPTTTTPAPEAQTANGGTAYPGYRTYRPQGGT